MDIKEVSVKTYKQIKKLINDEKDITDLVIVPASVINKSIDFDDYVKNIDKYSDIIETPMYHVNTDLGFGAYYFGATNNIYIVNDGSTITELSDNKSIIKTKKKVSLSLPENTISVNLNKAIVGYLETEIDGEINYVPIHLYILELDDEIYFFNAILIVSAVKNFNLSLSNIKFKDGRLYFTAGDNEVKMVADNIGLNIDINNSVVKSVKLNAEELEGEFTNNDIKIVDFETIDNYYYTQLLGEISEEDVIENVRQNDDIINAINKSFNQVFISTDLKLNDKELISSIPEFLHLLQSEINVTELYPQEYQELKRLFNKIYTGKDIDNVLSEFFEKTEKNGVTIYVIKDYEYDNTTENNINTEDDEVEAIIKKAINEHGDVVLNNTDLLIEYLKDNGVSILPKEIADKYNIDEGLYNGYIVAKDSEGDFIIEEDDLDF